MPRRACLAIVDRMPAWITCDMVSTPMAGLAVHDLSYRLYALRPQPEDIVVFTIDVLLTPDQLIEVRTTLKRELEKANLNNHLIVLSHDAQLYSFNPSDLKEGGSE